MTRTMNQTQTVAPEATSNAIAPESRLLRLMTVLAQHKKLILGVPFVVALVAAAISIALPNVYRAGTKLLPPQQA